jgi:hypothetical protein
MFMRALVIQKKAAPVMSRRLAKHDVEVRIFALIPIF